MPLTFEAFTSDDPDGEVIAYNWSFNDGTSLTSQTSSTAVHTFANAGEYRVRLWVMDDCGELSLVDEAMVTIAENTNPCANSAPPVAVAGPDLEADPGAPIQFDASASYDSDGRIDLYGWDFGDGRRSAGRLLTHSYQEPGTYIVTLIVLDDCFFWSETPDEVVVTVGDPDPCAGNSAPVALTSGPGSAPEDTPDAFNGSGSSDQDDNIDTYEWDFGDGNTDTGASVSHSYDEPGTYVATLTVTDECDLTDSDSLTLEIAEPDPCEGNHAPIAEATGPGSAETGQTLNFSGSGSSDPDDNIVTYEWDFGDGATASGAQVSHSYDTPGTYAVTLTVTDSCGATDADTPNVVVSDPGSGELTAEFTFSPQDPWVDDPATFTANAPASDGYLFYWTLSNGVSTFARSFSHAFDDGGDYEVTLMLYFYDTDETLDIAEPDPCADNDPPNAVASGPDSAPVNAPVTFSGSASSDPDGNLASYAWDFGDGATASGSQVSHTYDSAGTYTVTFTITEERGATDSDTLNVQVSDPGSGACEMFMYCLLKAPSRELTGEENHTMPVLGVRTEIPEWIQTLRLPSLQRKTPAPIVILRPHAASAKSRVSQGVWESAFAPATTRT